MNDNSMYVNLIKKFNTQEDLFNGLIRPIVESLRNDTHIFYNYLILKWPQVL